MDQALPEVFAAKQWGAQWQLVNLLSKWPEVVGAEVAQLTYPAFFRRETLCVFVQNSAWMHHLQYVKAELIARINQYLEDQPITDIRWQLHVPVPLPFEQPPAELRQIDPTQEHSFCQMTEAIANRECREALQRLWRTFAAHEKAD